MFPSTPPTPALWEARAAVEYVVKPIAQLLDGKLTIHRYCAVRDHARICHAEIRGPEPLTLRVRVFKTRGPNGGMYLDARIEKDSPTHKRVQVVS